MIVAGKYTTSTLKIVAWHDDGVVCVENVVKSRGEFYVLRVFMFCDSDGVKISAHKVKRLTRYGVPDIHLDRN